MVEIFKTADKKTLYAITGTRVLEEALKEIAAVKKESYEKVSKKFKTIHNGYMMRKGNNIELYFGAPVKGSKSCLVFEAGKK